MDSELKFFKSIDTDNFIEQIVPDRNALIEEALLPTFQLGISVSQFETMTSSSYVRSIDKYIFQVYN